MKIFVLGMSYSGKTPVAQAIGTQFGFSVKSAGEWIKESFKADCENMETYIAKITAASVQRLRADTRCGLEFFLGRYADLEHVVIDGQRNPYDFIHLFEPRTDFAITVRNTSSPSSVNEFESGVLVIGDYLGWLTRNGLIHPCQNRTYEFERLYRLQPSSSPETSLQGQIPAIIERLKVDLAEIDGRHAGGACEIPEKQFAGGDQSAAPATGLRAS